MTVVDDVVIGRALREHGFAPALEKLPGPLARVIHDYLVLIAHLGEEAVAYAAAKSADDISAVLTSIGELRRQAAGVIERWRRTHP